MARWPHFGQETRPSLLRQSFAGRKARGGEGKVWEAQSCMGKGGMTLGERQCAGCAQKCASSGGKHAHEGGNKGGNSGK